MRRFFMTTSEILIAEAVHYNGDWKQIVEAIREKKVLPPEEIIRINNDLKCHALTIMDKEYPEYLKHIFMPPIVLFYEGDISLINEPSKCLAVVGSRGPSEVGVSITKSIVKKTCKDFITVSGLANGIDRIAHKTAINNGGKTIAVLGSGIDCCYPSENQDIFDKIKKDHLLISEYPPGCPPVSSNFPIRNRLIAMFSKGILVTEARIKSGTSITATYGLNFGRTIMCVPSSRYDECGCNRLIKEGAFLVENADDVLFNMR